MELMSPRKKMAMGLMKATGANYSRPTSPAKWPEIEVKKKATRPGVKSMKY